MELLEGFPQQLLSETPIDLFGEFSNELVKHNECFGGIYLLEEFPMEFRVHFPMNILDFFCKELLKQLLKDAVN